MKYKQILIPLLISCIMQYSSFACGYNAQLLPDTPAELLYRNADQKERKMAEHYFLFRKTYDENLAKGDHHANLKLICRVLPEFYGDRREAEFYKARTDALTRWRNISDSPIVCSRVAFDVRDDKGYVLAELNNLTFGNITAFKVRFNVVGIDGKLTGNGKDHYYAVGRDIAPGEDEVFIWQVDDMVNPSMLAGFEVLELVFKNGERLRCDNNKT